MRWVLVLLGVVGCATGRAAAEPIVLTVAGDGKNRPCELRYDDNLLTMDDLDAVGRDWARQGRAVRVLGKGDIPWQCVGGAIYTLQRAGVVKVGFAAEPPAAGENR